MISAAADTAAAVALEAEADLEEVTAEDLTDMIQDSAAVTAEA